MTDPRREALEAAARRQERIDQALERIDRTVDRIESRQQDRARSKGAAPVTDDLTQFLLARIAEDEADAASMTERGGRIGCDFDATMPDLHNIDVERPERRLLAECEAKRRFVVLYQEALEEHRAIRAEEAQNPRSRRVEMEVGRAGAGLRHTWAALTIIAAVYADHPDYLQEWKPR